MKPLEVWTSQRAENLKKKSSKISKNNYAATIVSAARRQIIGGGGAPINKSQRRGRPPIVGGAARPAHGYKSDAIFTKLFQLFLSIAALLSSWSDALPHSVVSSSHSL